MKEETRDLTSGKLGRQILLFSLPLMFSNVLQVLFNMSDIAVVGRFAGAEALGSVGSTATLVALFTGFLIGMGSGVNAVVANRLGSKDDGGARESVRASFVVCLGTGLALLFVGTLSSRGLLKLLNTKNELLGGAVLYLKIYFFGMPALAVYNFGNAVLSASGDTKKPLIYLSLSGAANVLLNLFFVIVCQMSVAGVALASVISQYLSAFLIVFSLIRSKDSHALRFSGAFPDKNAVKRILALGLSSGLQNAIFQIANLFIQAGVNSFDTTMVEGNSAAQNADALVYDVMAAFYTACTGFIAQNLGAGKKDRILKSYFISLAYSFGIGAIMGLSLVFFGRSFLSLFTDDAAVAEAGMSRLTILGFSYAFSSFMDCAIAAARGLGKSVVPTVIVIMGSCVFRIVWIHTVFARFGTIPSLYLLYIFSWTITAIAETAYFAISYKKKTKNL